MGRPNLIMVFCVSLVCFLGSVKNLYANDPCTGTSSAPDIGQTCTGGAIYAGRGYSGGGLNSALRYMVTPGGCTDESCSGAGGTDSVAKSWANHSGTTAYTVNTGARYLSNGKRNTAILVTLPPNYTDTDAAHWCTSMNYGGYTDWYLPAKNELHYVLYANRAELGGFSSSIYWSSTEDSPNYAWFQYFVNGNQSVTIKTVKFGYVRCIRSY